MKLWDRSENLFTQEQRKEICSIIDILNRGAFYSEIAVLQYVRNLYPTVSWY